MSTPFWDGGKPLPLVAEPMKPRPMPRVLNARVRAAFRTATTWREMDVLLPEMSREELCRYRLLLELETAAHQCLGIGPVGPSYINEGQEMGEGGPQA